MTFYPSHELQKEMHHDVRDYLDRFPWEWSGSFTFQGEVDFCTAQRRFRRWHRRLLDEEEVQVGAYVASSYRQRRIHLHALLLGRNRHGKTLLDCSIHTWETRWYGHARIKRVDSNFWASDYLGLHFRGFKSERAQLNSYNRTLLARVMERRNDGLDGFDGLRPMRTPQDLG